MFLCFRDFGFFKMTIATVVIGDGDMMIVIIVMLVMLMKMILVMLVV